MNIVKMGNIQRKILHILKRLSIIIMIILFPTLMIVGIVAGVKSCSAKIEKELEELDTTVSKEVGRAIGNMVREFEEGLDDSRKNEDTE